MLGGSVFHGEADLSRPATPSAQTPETPFLRELFGEMKARSIRYCVLRNYESLPDSLGGHDLDLLVDPRDSRKAPDLIVEMGKKYRGRLHQLRRNSDTVAVRCFGVKDGIFWGVPIDINDALRCKGVDYYDLERVLSRASDRGGVMCADPTDAAPIAYLKQLLFQGYIPERYLQMTKDLAIRNSEEVASLMTEIFGEKGRILVEDFMAQGVAPTPEITSALRRAFLWRGLKRHPGATLSRKAANRVLHLRRVMHRPGISVACLGPDGAGKSTQIQLVRDECERLLHIKTKGLYWRPKVVPRLARLFGGPGDEYVGAIANPHKDAPSNSLSSTLRVAYYLLDYIGGYNVLRFGLLTKSATIVFFDRYCYDYLFDPKRRKISLPPSILRRVLGFVPEPDLIILLRARAEVMRHRKPELPVDELERQLRAMDALPRQFRNVHVVDSSGSLEETRNAILRLIFHRFCTHDWSMGQGSGDIQARAS